VSGTIVAAIRIQRIPIVVGAFPAEVTFKSPRMSLRGSTHVNGECSEAGRTIADQSVVPARKSGHHKHPVRVCPNGCGNRSALAIEVDRHAGSGADSLPRKNDQPRFNMALRPKWENWFNRQQC
jgi:hypothetical protein